MNYVGMSGWETSTVWINDDFLIINGIISKKNLRYNFMRNFTLFIQKWQHVEKVLKHKDLEIQLEVSKSFSDRLTKFIK